MNREIKFRAWNKLQNRMLEGIPFEEHHFDGVIRKMVKREDLIFMQYTDLKDKNGVEIYEGDVVKFKDLNYDVYWSKGMAGFRVESKKGIAYITGDLFKTVDEECEVIGNIYQNKELLNNK